MSDDFNNAASVLKRETEELTELLRRERPDLNAVLRLIDGGVPVGTPCVNKESFLTLAAFYGHEEIIGQLLRRDADIDHQNIHGDTALTYAIKRDHRYISLMLANAGANVLLGSHFRKDSHALNSIQKKDWPEVAAKITALAAKQLPSLVQDATILRQGMKPLRTLKFKAP